MNSFSKLVELFSEFPGIGSRQAKRFVYFLLHKPSVFNDELIKSIENLKKEIKKCNSCFRVFSESGGNTPLCSICRNQHRDQSILAVVSNDSDLDNIEKSGSYNGLYFVLGGILPILEKDPDKKVRSKEFLKLIEAKLESGELKEIILAMSLNSEGENTADYMRNLLSPYAKKLVFKISNLGRGLSTGTELEYSDTETLKNALKNRN